MIEVAITNWNAFVEEVNELEQLRDSMKAQNPLNVSELLFRGQPNAAWQLTTTLERAQDRKNVPVQSYHTYACAVKAELESFTGQEWPIPNIIEYDNRITAKNGHPRYFYYDNYSYYVHLRHHGFPSPLLDWTASPYVAAFFAMRNPPVGAESVAVYVYLEKTDLEKVTKSSEPNIHSMGPVVKTHRRHYLQQSRYTYCIKIDQTLHPMEGIAYGCHEDVAAREAKEHDILWKWIIPISEHRVFLHKLNRMNINAFSLFANEESLVESLAVQQFLLRDFIR
jgi:hypothetical protein